MITDSTGRQSQHSPLQHHPVLQARDVHVLRGAATVVKGVSLSAQAGQWLAIVGPNGAGKSSLLQALAGLWPAASGDVQLQGRALAQWPVRERARIARPRIASHRAVHRHRRERDQHPEAGHVPRHAERRGKPRA